MAAALTERCVIAPCSGSRDEVKAGTFQFVGTRHSAYAYPRVVEFIGELPKTLTGKIRRIELRQREFEGA